MKSVDYVPVRRYLSDWINPAFRPTALRVAVVVGSVLFTINHGSAVLDGTVSAETAFMMSFIRFTFAPNFKSPS